MLAWVSSGWKAFFHSASARKVFLVIAAVLVCLNAVLVVGYAQTVPDFGIRCAFGTDIIRKFDSHFRPGDQPTPQLGDRIEEFNDRHIDTWLELLQEMDDIFEHDPVTVAELPPDHSQLAHVRLGNEELVRFRFLSKADGQVYTIWTLVDRTHVDSLVPSLLWFLLKGTLFFIALLVYWMRPADRSAALFFWFSIVTVGAYMGGYHWWRIVTKPPLLLIFMFCGILMPAVTLHFFVSFPRQKKVLERRPWAVLAAIYSLPILFLAIIVFQYCRSYSRVHGGLLLPNPGAASDPVEINAGLQVMLGWIFLYLATAGVWYLISIACLVHSYFVLEGVERNQVKSILFGSVAALVPIGYTLYLAFFNQEDFGSGAATWPMFAASVCFTVAFAVSITRYRLLQLDQIVSSGMVYFLISFMAGLAYYAVVFAGTLLIGRRVIAGPSLGQALMVSTTALLLTIVLDLARSRLKKVLDRRFHRDKHHLDKTLQRMGQAVEQLVDPPTLARRLLQASAELLGVYRGAVYLREGHPPLYRLVDTLGLPPPLTELSHGCPLIDTLQVRPTLMAHYHHGTDASQGQLRFLGGEVAQALIHEGHLLALLVLGPKDSGPYTTDDCNLLAALAQITALALENAERHHTIDVLNRDLQDKVDKISEQQRRILTLQSQLLKDDRPPPSAPEPTAHGAAAAADGAIVGSSPVVRDLLQLVRKVAQSPSAVLLRGESGTGKELLARSLHENSPRAGKAFVKVHCAALSAGLLESELFGHVKGAFTGAHRDKVGRFEMANGGTLFLDEIGDITLETQTRLLRVLQEMTFERVGSSEPVKVDVRVIAATHQDLEKLIVQGRFREDLYYRLNVISIQVPALRERREDVAELAAHFLKVYGQRSGKPVTQIDDDALAALKGYGWPGNIRQLENVVERAVVVAESSTITLDELPPELLTLPPAESADPTKPVYRSSRLTPLIIGRSRDDREQRERERLVRALAQAKGNKAEAARALGVARSTLLSRLKKFGLS